MRRQGNFADSPASGYGAGQIQNAHSDFQGQLEAFTPERDQPSQPEGQWRWERDGPPNMSRPMPTAVYNESTSLYLLPIHSHVRFTHMELYGRASIMRCGCLLLKSRCQ